jgi:hypothetical protein
VGDEATKDGVDFIASAVRLAEERMGRVKTDTEILCEEVTVCKTDTCMLLSDMVGELLTAGVRRDTGDAVEGIMEG